MYVCEYVKYILWIYNKTRLSLTVMAVVCILICDVNGYSWEVRVCVALKMCSISQYTQTRIIKCYTYIY